MRNASKRGRLGRWMVLWVLAAGCVPKVSGLGMRDVDLAVPGSFGDGAGAENDLEALRQGRVFEDPLLVALIEEALANNQELEILRQEVHEEQAEIVARRGKPLPEVGLFVGAGVEKVGRYTSQGAADATTEMLPGKEVPEHLGDFSLGFEASWEIDVWKKLRNGTAAARMRTLASVEGRRFVATGVVAEVARGYYELVALDRQIGVLDANLAILDEALKVVRLQQAAARVTILGVQRFEAEVLKNKAHRMELVQRRTVVENELNAVVGRYPQPIARTSEVFDAPELPELSAGLPSQLLTRRPDLRQAEAQLAAQKLDVKVARAKFLPSLAIDAELGIEAFTPEKLVTLPASLLYSVAANLLTPLINRAEIKAEWIGANARQMQAVVAYEQAVLLAFVDVANHLAEIGNVDAGYALKEQQVQRLDEAIETSNLLFRSARADYLEVLTTRREALEAEMELVEMRQQQLAARINLYRSLGGGWPGALPEHEPMAVARAARGEAR